MGWFSDALEGAVDWVGDTLETAVKNPAETLLTGGLNTQVAATQKAFNQYQWRNGGRQAELSAKKMADEYAAQQKTDAAAKLAGESMLASMPYASAFGQPNASLMTRRTQRKTILGSF